MRVKLSTGKELNVFITHVKPKMTTEDILEGSPFTQEAANYLAGGNFKENRQNGTVAVITEGEEQLGIGTAKLAPVDSFNRHLGLQIALGRAISKIGLEKKERATIWDQVFQGKYTKKK